MDDLLAMGFDEVSSQAALRKAGGNVDRAIDLLISNSIESSDGAGDQLQNIVEIPASGVLIPLQVSQYSYGESGASACTVIAGTMLKLLLGHLKLDTLVTEENELSEAVRAGVRHYQSLPSTMRNHLSIDELGPYMTESLHCKGVLQGLLSTRNHFEDLFEQARACSNPTDHIGIVITKPPETVCVILPPASCSASLRKYILFDSHSRPQLGLPGSYLYFSDNQGDVIQRLKGLFIPLPMEGGSNADFMQQMYNMFDGSVFQIK